MGKLSGRVAIITGGGGGQGAATAALFAEHGANVVVADIAAEAGAAVAAEIGNNAFFHRMDVTEGVGWKDMIEATLRRWGRIDILINNAALVKFAPILDVSAADFELVYRVNVLGAFLGIKAVAPTMIDQKKGAIVNISSTMGMMGMNGIAAYSASKWGLRGLTRTAAMELGHKGIRINTIFPGGINTAMANPENLPLETINQNYRGQPIQRIGEAEEVSRASLFLVSDDASYICGAELAVDGGMTLGVYKPYMPGSPDNM